MLLQYCHMQYRQFLCVENMNMNVSNSLTSACECEVGRGELAT